MEPEILHTLLEIRGTLYLICGIFIVGFGLLIFHFVTNFRKLEKSLSDWREEANELFIKGWFEDLIKLCVKREKSHPFDPSVYWWQARAYLEKGDIERANELFTKVLEIDPGWDEYVRPYKAKIKSQ